jgi:hypothetical protein
MMNGVFMHKYIVKVYNALNTYILLDKVQLRVLCEN